jgi:HK97 family phage major capsid protein
VAQEYEVKSDKDLQTFVDGITKRVGDVEQVIEGIDNIDDRFGDVEKVIKEVKEDVAKAASRFVNNDGKRVVGLPATKAEFQAGGFKALYQARTGSKATSDGMLVDNDGTFARWQKAGDDLQIVAGLTAATRGVKKVDPRSLGFYKSHYMPAFEPVKTMLKDAMDTASGGPGAGDWIPTEMSRQLEPLVERNYRVVNFIRRERLPRFPFQYPVQTGVTAFTIKAQETATWAGGGSPSNAAGDALGTTDITGNVTFGSGSGGVLAGVFTITDEADEDSIVALVPFARMEMPKGLARHQEDAVLNGDITGTHMDSDVTASTDHRKLFYGLRYFALQNTSTSVDAGGNKINTNANVAAYIRNLVAGMGGYGDLQQFGDVPQDLCVAVDTKVFNQLLEIPEYRHLNTFGGNATIQGVNANIAFPLDGMNLVVSAKQRDNLNGSGVYDGVTIDQSSLIIFHRDAWVLGEVRAPRVQVFTDSYFRLYGLMGIMLDQRNDMQAVKDNTAASQKHTVITYGVGT